MKTCRRYIRIQYLLALVVILALPMVAQAKLMCRSDPKLTLTDGTKLAIGASIEADKSDILLVSYELHVPVGVDVASKVHTPGWQQDLETFVVIADQAPNQYFVITTAHTALGNAAVTAYVQVTDQGKTTYQTSGVEGQPLTVAFSS